MPVGEAQVRVPGQVPERVTGVDRAHATSVAVQVLVISGVLRAVAAAMPSAVPVPGVAHVAIVRVVHQVAIRWAAAVVAAVVANRSAVAAVVAVAGRHLVVAAVVVVGPHLAAAADLAAVVAVAVADVDKEK